MKGGGYYGKEENIQESSCDGPGCTERRICYFFVDYKEGKDNPRILGFCSCKCIGRAFMRFAPEFQKLQEQMIEVEARI